MNWTQVVVMIKVPTIALSLLVSRQLYGPNLNHLRMWHVTQLLIAERHCLHHHPLRHLRFVVDLTFPGRHIHVN